MPTCPTCRQAREEGATACPDDGTLLVPDPLLGQVLGERYRLLERIGAGGMGTVYRAEHVVLRKQMAVKVLRPELSADDELVRRFQQEAVAASAIGQENIVNVTDFGRTPQGSLYFVMEELEGQSLGVLLQAGPLQIERVVLLLAQVCRALAAAHGRGIVHRDLKPDNVIVVRREDGSDFVKVVDFGISKNGAGPERGRVTRAGTIIGTPEYMAPEQGAAAPVDHRADIYAFGVLAYELLTGVLPFHGECAIATLIEHQTKSPEPPSRLRPGLPPELEALILRALEKRREERQQSMVEVASELTRVLAGLGLPPVYDRAPTPLPAPAPMSGFTERFAPVTIARRSTGRGGTIALEPAVTAERPLTPARVRRLPRVAAVVLALSAVLALGTAASWRRGGVRPAPAVDGAASTRAPPATAVPPAPVIAPERTPIGKSELAATASSGDAPRRTSPYRGPRPSRRSAAARARPALGERQETGENPYRKLDDLKPDPF